MNSSSLWFALALLLIFEGLLPFISPSAWRKTFAQLMTLTDGQIRFFGLCSLLLGLVCWVLLS